MPDWAKLLAGKSFKFRTSYDPGEFMAGAVSFGKLFTWTGDDGSQAVGIETMFSTTEGDANRRYVEVSAIAAGEELRCSFDRNPVYLDLPKAGRRGRAELWCPNDARINELEFKNAIDMLLRLDGQWMVKANK